MRLEQLRENDIGSVSVWIPSLGNEPEAMTRLTYMQFAHHAFCCSTQQIEQLEMSTTQINQGNAIQATIGLWFMSIESYLNSILRISCLVKGLSFDDIKKKELDARITILFEILEIDRNPFYVGTFQKLSEFKRYRNELFHDRTNLNPLTHHKTSFSGNPFLANQVDVMQAAVIATQTFISFRYIIPKIDLIPQVMVTKNESFFYEKIDVLFNKFLAPYFQQSLAKHSLTSDVDLSIVVLPLSESNIFTHTPVDVLIKAIPDKQYHAPPSQERTRIGEELIKLVRESAIFDTRENFRIANFYR